jgi:hypothetical protein
VGANSPAGGVLRSVEELEDSCVSCPGSTSSDGGGWLAACSRSGSIAAEARRQAPIRHSHSTSGDGGAPQSAAV